MVDDYLSKWIKIIEEMANDNTYKTAWGRAIIECVYLDEYKKEENTVIINQRDIAAKMIKYYWNQTFFFNLRQGNNPVIVQYVQEMIDMYKKAVSSYPVPWDKAEPFFLKKHSKYYNRIISKSLTNAKTNVCPRFRNVKGGITLNIYEINDKDRLLYFNYNDIQVIKEYAFVLSKLLNYKWAQLLETYNLAPNIVNKVNAAAERKIKRKSLTKYKNLLLKYYHHDEIRDFYTGELIDKQDIHVDHVIPWSFVYTDEIWNLVITKSTNNLEKSNKPPTKLDLENLNKRNLELINRLGNDNTKYKRSLIYAVENNLLDKLYINMKG